MRSFPSKKSIRVDEDNPYWMSFSDLMSALLVIFILAAVMLIIELAEQKKRIDQDISKLQYAIQARKDILYEIKKELAKYKILVEVAENHTVLRIPDTTLTFASNSHEIPVDKKVREMVKRIGFVLQTAITEPFDKTKSKSNLKRFKYLDTVFIEGHTDSDFSGKEKGNWGLSSYRAISLWEFWEKNLPTSSAFSKMKNESGQKMFSVSGYSSTRRLNMVERTDKDKAANRRIDIRFTVKQPKLSTLKEIVETSNSVRVFPEIGESAIR